MSLERSQICIVTCLDQAFSPSSFVEIAEVIRCEPGMLPVSPDSLYLSYERGRAVALVDGNRIVGYIRCCELVTAQLRRQLCLPDSLPDIYEIGSAIILGNGAHCCGSVGMNDKGMNVSRYRGQGFYTQMRHSLLGMFLPQIDRQEVLILGTTTDSRVVSVLRKAQNLGINFYLCHHEEFAGIYPFTCTCDGVPGYGCQYGPSFCFRRISSDVLPFSSAVSVSISLEDRINRVIAVNGIQQNCVMYVSDESLARRVNDEVLSRFGTREILIDRLSFLGYYQRSYE